MSIATNPELYDYSVPPNVCPLCYDVGKTPETLFLCFSEIKIGALWTPADPPPPNGTFAVVPTNPCKWQVTASGFDFYYQSIMGDTECGCNITGGGLCFGGLFEGDCHLWFDNALVAPGGNKYYDGSCGVVPSLEGGIYSIAWILQLLSKDPIWATWINPIPISEQLTVYKLYNAIDHTNIKIKIDHS